MKKFLSLVLALALALSLAACGGTGNNGGNTTGNGGNANTSAGTNTSADADTGDDAGEAGFTTVEEGKLIMSTNAAFPPYEMTTDDGGFEGIDVEIAQAIAEKLGPGAPDRRHGFHRRPGGCSGRHERHGHGGHHR